MTHKSAPRVAVIDDDDMVAKVLLAHLRAAGCEARATDSIDVFIEWAASWNPSLVFVDLVLGEDDGLTVLSRLAASNSSAGVIIMSGSDHRVLHSAREFAMQSGLADAGYLSKPFGRQDVLDALSRQVRVSSDPAHNANSLAAWDSERFAEELESAISNNHLSAVFQPKVDCRSGAVVGFEALARWNHPRLGPIPPTTFIARAEREGLVRPITRAIMGRAFEWFGARRAHAHEHISINISAMEVSNPDDAKTMRRVCSELGIAPQRVMLEVTETAALAESRTALEVLTRLRLDGFSLSIDDFGTGYSTMSQLTMLPFSELKIDTSFVRKCLESRSARVMVESAIAMARGLNLSCTAEGVEDQATLEKVTEMGCDFAQGYHIARPMPGPVVDEWLRNRPHPPKAPRALF